MPFRSEKFLTYVRAHDCCACGKSSTEYQRSEAHHCVPPGVYPSHHGGGRGQKMHDTFTVPVCGPISDPESCHAHWHASNTYRRFKGMSVQQSDELIAATQVKLLAHYIRLVDSSTDLF